MKKPERMKNKTTKAFLYQNLYPVNLYVTTLDDWEDACDFFDFFLTTKELRNDEPERDRPKLSSVMRATFLVREKYSRAVGILIVLDDFHCSTLAHESTHYADAVYDYLSMNAEGYNEGNEQYAYLVTWCVEQLEDFIECKRKEKGMNTEEKLDKILLNQQVILLYLRQILQDTNRSQFLEDYAANLAAQATEIILGHNIVRK